MTETDLAEYAAKHLAPYKRPSDIFLISTMPMTASGKIAKGDLAKIANHTNQGETLSASTQNLPAEPSRTLPAK